MPFLIAFILWACCTQLAAAQNKGVIYFEQGEQHFEQDSFRKAIQMYSKALLLRKDFTLAYISRGIAYERLEQFEKATADYNIALSQDPSIALLHNNLGWLNYRQIIMQPFKIIIQPFK